MWKVIHTFIILWIVLMISSQTYADETTCFQKVMKQQEVGYQVCVDDLQKNEKMRASEKKQQIDLLERLIRVSVSSSKEAQTKRSLCENEMIQFFSHYGIRNMNRPELDMGPELLGFWNIFLNKCPSLKGKSQSASEDQ